MTDASNAHQFILSPTDAQQQLTSENAATVSGWLQRTVTTPVTTRTLPALKPGQAKTACRISREVLAYFIKSNATEHTQMVSL